MIKGCILPWIHMYGDIRGNYSLCCHTDNYFDRGQKQLGQDGESPLKVWNDEAYKKKRLQFLQGEYPAECSVCYDIEKSGQDSHRNRANNKYARYGVLQDKTGVDGSVKNPPVWLDFRFGNLCNFKCRMCGPDASTSWFREKHLAAFKAEDKQVQSLDYWTNNPEFWKDMEKIYKTIDTIYFAGGEPFVQDGMYKMLEFLIEHGKTDIELQYNSNLSYSKYKKYDIVKLWKNFREVKLWPSVEGYKEHVEYSRKGFVWETFAENLKIFKDYIQVVSATGNIYSILSNPELIMHLKKLNIQFFITNLISPPFMDTSVLPSETKKQINQKYKKFLTENKNWFNKQEINTILNSLRHMNRADNSHLLPELKKFNTALDLSRNESFEATFPEYAEWYRKI